ncbi:hypothetical protein [Nocardioides acrostichi]|uniref:Uncharacterized protein n=1 Tax=Nocardioides acrostichi TaxID=2784339 RepID=A0A930YAL8_9ACTN|nr:hypothetical protein [Nocardioides acrostichi]MBF4161528.1 hypothetical protein [Nocardioides acrostichi]
MRFLVRRAEPDHFERWATADDAERTAFFDALRASHEAVSARGAIVAREGLAAPDRAVTLRKGAVTQGQAEVGAGSR